MSLETVKYITCIRNTVELCLPSVYFSSSVTIKIKVENKGKLLCFMNLFQKQKSFILEKIIFLVIIQIQQMLYVKNLCCLYSA